LATGNTRGGTGREVHFVTGTGGAVFTKVRRWTVQKTLDLSEELKKIDKSTVVEGNSKKERLRINTMETRKREERRSTDIDDVSENSTAESN